MSKALLTQAAISLSFDDGSDSHIDTCMPLLEEFNLRGTFYVPLKSAALDRSEAWRAGAERGHEIGNHTIFHPCRKGPNKQWPADHYNLAKYSPQRFKDEVYVANQVLRLLDGETTRTYGNTCHNNWIGTGETSVCLETLLPDHFLCARGEKRNELIDLNQPNRYNLGTRSMDGATGPELIAAAQEAIDQQRWLIITAHNVNEEDAPLTLRPSALRELGAFLAQNQAAITCAPVRDIGHCLFSDG